MSTDQYGSSVTGQEYASRVAQLIRPTRTLSRPNVRYGARATGS
jgi:hypothetical protein